MCFSVYAVERPTRGVDDDVWQRCPAVALGHSASRPFAARAILALAGSGENRWTTAMLDGLWSARDLRKQRCEFPAHEQRPDNYIQAPQRSDGIPNMLRRHEARILARISARNAVRASSAVAPLSGVSSVIPQRASIASCTGFDEGMNTNDRGR